jgi:hypothetical protein
MQTTLLIDGGLGRNVCAIPALEQYVRNNPDTLIITHHWTAIFWGNKLLTDNVFDAQTKGLFEKVKCTKIIKPEPYFNSNFLNERINMVQAFGEELEIDCEGEYPKLYFSRTELNNSRQFIDSSKKTIVFQPFGSSAVFQNGDVIDITCRSMTFENAKFVLDSLKKLNYQVLLIDSKGVFDPNEYQNLDHLPYRDFSSVIANSDYFLGVDSCGQHIAHALGKPGCTFFGGSSYINYGYPEHFLIIKKDVSVKYSSMRIGEFDTHLANLVNDDLLCYNSSQIQEIFDGIHDDIERKT